ncbi:hypothetical protein ACWCPT_05960 [Streptomyces sp. NPDC002308]
MTVLAWVFFSIGLYAASLVPFLLLVDADHLTPRALRHLPLTGAAILMLLGGTDV